MDTYKHGKDERKRFLCIFTDFLLTGPPVGEDMDLCACVFL